MSEHAVLVEQSNDGIVKLTLNRPRSLNAISVELLDELVSLLYEHRHARVIVLEGAGERSFCAGEDLKQTLAPQTGSAQELRQSFDKLQDLTRLTSSSRAIVVSAVQGFAIGGGAEIALAADFVVGGPNAKFRFPEVTLGHAVTGGISLRLPQLVGLLKAKELLITGRWVDAEEALRLGMLSEISDDPKQRAVELALQLARLPAVALECSKMALERSTFDKMEACLQDEVNVASYCFAQTGAHQAFSNFAARKDKSMRQALVEESKDIPIRDINSAFAHAVKTFPERTFFRFIGNDISFGDFDLVVQRLAGGPAQAGVSANDRVLDMMRNCIEMAYIWMATNRLGAVWVPINTGLKSITLKHVITAAQPKLAVVGHELLAEFAALEILDPSSIYVKGGDESSSNTFSKLLNTTSLIESPVTVAPGTTAAFLYTSGTTGKSKPCVLSHEYFILQAKALIHGCGLRQDDVLYCPFPMFHADATALTIIPAILLGATAAIAPPADSGKKSATIGLRSSQPPRPGSHRYQLRIADDMNEEVQPNVVGHLLLRTDVPNAFFDGYFNDPTSTAAAFAGTWFHTGDLARVDMEGNIYFMGRVKDVIRRRGENVNASEVEDEFMQHPDVVIAAAYGIPSQLGAGTEEDVKVAVQLRPGSNVDEEALWRWAVTHIARFQLPSVIEFVREIKRTPTGKVEKYGLKVDGGRRFDIREVL
ncbi:hypothetical protein N0V83_004152 [Neocucurbitaria cava]|uniref:Acetyl-CoA synthetase-like protein n=1 Tax=Neocucurbitaria cava TaxID=798079 RepID=A0A9W8YDM7_9PLEO|nr:hypothetical protein N0V83_004152 [Neocucurbitaria cava]